VQIQTHTPVNPLLSERLYSKAVFTYFFYSWHANHHALSYQARGNIATVVG